MREYKWVTALWVSFWSALSLWVYHTYLSPALFGHPFVCWPQGDPLFFQTVGVLLGWWGRSRLTVNQH